MKFHETISRFYQASNSRGGTLIHNYIPIPQIFLVFCWMCSGHVENFIFFHRMREMEAHRLMRAGSIPPGYMPGMPPGASNLETAQMMDHIRRMQGNPMMNMYPGLSTQHALSMMNEQHQREALMERALAAGMMQAGHNPAGLSHMHGLHPELAGSAQDQAALFHMMHGGGNPFVRAPFMGSHNPGPNAEMLQQLGQQMGRATAMDQEAAYFHAAQAAQAQVIQGNETSACVRWTISIHEFALCHRSLLCIRAKTGLQSALRKRQAHSNTQPEVSPICIFWRTKRKPSAFSMRASVASILLLIRSALRLPRPWSGVAPKISLVCIISFRFSTKKFGRLCHHALSGIKE